MKELEKMIRIQPNQKQSPNNLKHISACNKALNMVYLQHNQETWRNGTQGEQTGINLISG